MLITAPIPLLIDNPQLHDDRLSARVERALSSSGYFELRGIKVTARNGHVLLQGRLHSYYLKQMACSLTLDVTGVVSIDDELDVD